MLGKNVGKEKIPIMKIKHRDKGYTRRKEQRGNGEWIGTTAWRETQAAGR